MRTFLLLGITLLVLFAANAARAQVSSLRPALLRCEDRENPAGVDVPQPRLGWVLQSAERGAAQTGWQILAASSSELLTRDRADLWDSGNVRSGASNQIAWAGRPLVSSQAVFWKVRVQDAAGKLSAWSAPATWIMGIVAETDWHGAKWIGAPGSDQPFDSKAAVKGPRNPYETVLLRRALPVRPGLKRAVVHVSGLGQYEMTLNGRKVGDALLTPGWTSYEKTCLYDTYEITPDLATGDNVVGLFLGNGFFNNHRGRYTWAAFSQGYPQAIALIRLEYADGSIENVVTDEAWRAHSGPITYSTISGGEDYDARLMPQGWDRPAFDAAQWEASAATPGPGGKLRGMTVAAPPIRVMQTFKPAGSKTLSSTVTVHDFGQNASIVARIRVSGPAGSQVKMTPSELINDKGDINDRMTRGESYCTYTLGGKGEETYQWKFYYRGARYLRVETRASPDGGALPVVQSVEADVIRSEAPPAGSFECSDERVNRTCHLIRWAQMSNTVSVITDCPTREKLGYLEQLHLNGPAFRYNFDLSAHAQKCVNDMADAQSPNGKVPLRAPFFGDSSGEGFFVTSIEWGSACILLPWQQYEFTGDIALLRTSYPMMQRYMEYLAGKSKDSIITFGLGDWYDNLSEGKPTLTPVPLTGTAFYYQDARVMAGIAALLGRTDDAKRYVALADRVRAAFNQMFFDPVAHQYAKGAQGSNCLPLAMGLVDPAEQPAVLDHLVKDLQANGLTAGEVSFRYLLRALADNNRHDVIYRSFTNDANGYGLQVKLGKTTLTEAWNGGNSSQNHFMFGQINEWYFHDLAGIQGDPAGPGFRKIVIKPALVGGLTWVKASYRCPTGDIVSEWTNGPAGVTMHVTVPVGSTAAIHVPAADPALVRESGAPAARASGLTFLRMENGAAVYAAVSGSYAFSSGSAAAVPRN